VISVTIAADKLEAFKEAIGYNARNSRMEKGCIRFDVTQD
jgi:quinol monooxygenase YgiN